jgi:hypothetical protein
VGGWRAYVEEGADAFEGEFGIPICDEVVVGVELIKQVGDVFVDAGEHGTDNLLALVEC